MSKWIEPKALERYPLPGQQTLADALQACVERVEDNLGVFAQAFPGAASEGGYYRPGSNYNWTTGFWTGEVWLAYENEERDEQRAELLAAGQWQVSSFLDRIERKFEVDHHDMGFLYSPSCVAAYKLTGNPDARRAAMLAAEQLLSRFQPVGAFLQAWGAMGAADNYRFIIDCLLNLPLLYWASEESGDAKYRDIAEQHIHTAMRYVIREDDSTWHTVFMDPVSGDFVRGATCQGYQDGSAWARGQAWGVYGAALAYRYTGREEYLGYFRRVSNYFLAHLPKDLCPYWDLSFGDGDEEPRDSSSAAIAVCGMLEMARYMEAEEAEYWKATALRILGALIERYQSRPEDATNGQLLHGTYSKKTPYNTCTQEGVDECVIWGDYFFMEALHRVCRPDWELYW